MSNFYTLEDYQNNIYDQLPKVLRKGKYIALSNNARVLYAVLKERHELSVRNRWIDDQGRIYFYFAQKDLAIECCISPSTVWRALQDLHKIGLIDTKRQGLQLNNIMYLCKPDLVEELVYDNKEDKNEKPQTLDIPLISQIDKSGLVKMTSPDSSKRLTSNNKYNKTKKNKTESYQSINPSEHTEKVEGEKKERYSEEYIKNAIDYDALINTKGMQKEDIDGIVNIISDVLNSRLEKVRISMEDMPIEVVKSRFLKLNMFHVAYVLDNLNDYDKRIYDPKSWLRTALYNAPSTISAHYTNRVNIDQKLIE